MAELEDYRPQINNEEHGWSMTDHINEKADGMLHGNRIMPDRIDSLDFTFL